MKIQHYQRKAIFDACKALNIDEETRHLMISSITNGRTDSMSIHTGKNSRNDMTSDEAQRLIRLLTQKQVDADKVAITAITDEMKAMRRKIYNYCYRMQWTQPEDEKKIDFKRLQDWQNTYCPVKKNINYCTDTELKKIITQMSIMVKNHEEKKESC